MELACCRADCALPLWFQMPLSVVVPLEIILLEQQPLSDHRSLWLRVLVVYAADVATDFTEVCTANQYLGVLDAWMR